MTVWNTLRLGAGGEVQNLALYSDGTALCRTDTYGAYILNRSTGLWSQLFSTSSLQSADYTLGGVGCYEMVAAPSNTSTFYSFLHGYLLKSTDKGASWARTTFTNDTTDYSNQPGTKTVSPKILVDPQNANFLMAGSPLNWNSSPTTSIGYSSNGGASWSYVLVASVPACGQNGVFPGTSTPAPGGYIFVVDPNSTISGGVTQRWYCGSYANGFYRTDNAGVTWTFLNASGYPSTFQSAYVDSSGLLWVVDESYGAQDGLGYLNKYDPTAGTWTRITTPFGQLNRGFTLNPSNTAQMYIGGEPVYAGSGMAYSANSGSAWTTLTHTPTVITADIPWIAWWMNSGSPSATDGGGLFMDPFDGTLYSVQGTGILYVSSPPTTNTDYTWNSKSAPIEQLVTVGVKVSPNGNIFAVVEDRGVMVSTNPAVYPSTYATDATFIAGTAVDYASSDANTIVVITNAGSNDPSGVSSNGGSIWSQFGTLTGLGADWMGNVYGGGSGGIGAPLGGGMIAASTAANFCAVLADYGTNINSIYYTTNGGSTWTAGTGLPSPSLGLLLPPYSGHATLCADRVTVGHFYIQLGSNGLYRSINSGASWTQVSTMNPGGFSVGARMKAVPGTAGYLYYTPGHDSLAGLYRSPDGGASWPDLPNGLPLTYNVVDFDFGPPAPGHTAASIWAYMTYNGVTGLYFSIDDASTWTYMDGPYPVVAGLADFPGGQWDQINCLAASQTSYQTVYIGTQGHGVIYTDFSGHLCNTTVISTQYNVSL